MSNIKDNSVIALLDAKEDIQVVLDTSLWISKRLNNVIGLLYSTPSNHKMKAIDYSGCLNIDDEEHMLQELANEDYQTNLNLKNQGKELLLEAQNYCKKNGHADCYPLHRQCSIKESVNYVDEKVDLIIIGEHLTCDTTLSDLIRVTQSPVLLTCAPFSIPKTAVFAFDNKATCHNIVEELSTGSLSRLFRNMCLHIVMVAEQTETNTEALREAYAKLTQAGLKCKKKLINIDKVFDVSSAVLAYQHKHELDMLISGSFGQSRLREWIKGSETQRLLECHKTPYLLFPKAQ